MHDPWMDQYLPLDKTAVSSAGGRGRYLEIKWVRDPSSAAVDPEILVEDIGFTALRPDASSEWLDYLLTEQNVLDRVNAAAQNDLAQYLGLADQPESLDWRSLLAAETVIRFNTGGSVSEIERLNGEHSTVQTAGGTTTVTTTTLDGSSTQVQIPAGGSNGHSYTQRITRDNGTPANLMDDYTEIATIAYGRVRNVTRDHDHKQPLEYSYEFDDSNREITVVHDPDSGVIEKYFVVLTSQGEQNKVYSQIAANGVETRYAYNDAGELVRTDILYKGRVRESFEQSISAEGLHAVTAQSGVTEYYDDAGVLKEHKTPDGYRYVHGTAQAENITVTMETQTIVLCDDTREDCSAIEPSSRVLHIQFPVVSSSTCLTNCVDVHQITLKNYTDKDGNVATYEGSKLSELKLASGLELSFAGFITEESKNENGETIEVRKPRDVTVFFADGTIVEFKNGLPFSVTSAAGRVINIQPDETPEVDGGHPRGVVPVLMNPSAAAEFHYAEALKLWNETILPQFTKYQLPRNTVVETEFSVDGSKLVSKLFSQGEREIYNEQGKIDYVITEEGELSINYDYDADGNITGTHLDGARRSLEQNIQELKTEIALQRYAALLKLTNRQQVVYETIEGEYILQRQQLLVLRERIEAQRGQISGMNARGRAAQNAIADGMGQINAGLSQVNGALAELANRRANTLQNVTDQVVTIRDQIESEANKAYTDIAQRETEIHASILDQESYPVIFHWYRKLLGRDPSKSEYESDRDTWANYSSGTFNIQSFKQKLLDSQERANRVAEVNAIRAAVRAVLQEYVSKTNLADKKQIALNLGITQDLYTALSSTEIDAVLNWLNSRDLHFGQSAYIALEALLDDAGIIHNRIDLARDLILADIFTGTITPIDHGELLLSFYAMNLYAKRFGLNLSPMAMSYDALKSLVVSLQSSVSAQQRVVVRVDGNHFVMITGFVTRVEDGKTIEEVQYLDPGAGVAGGEPVTITKEEFLKIWNDPTAAPQGTTNDQRLTTNEFGYVLSPRAPPESQITNHESRLLSASEAMSVRGSFFFLIPLIIAAIVAIVQAVVAAVVVVITAIIGALVGAVSAIVGGLGTFFGGLIGNFSAVFSGLFTGIVHGLSFLGNLVVNLGHMIFNVITWAPNWVVANLGIKSSLVGSIIFSSVLGGEFMAFGKALEFVGVSPKITNIIIAGGKIIAGASLLVFGGGALGVEAGLSIGAGLISGGAADIAVSTFHLSPLLGNIISIGVEMATIFAGGIHLPGATGWELLKTSLPTLLADLSSSGMQFLGNNFGLDPRLTGLLNFGVSAVVGGLANGLTRDNFVVGIDPITGAKIVVPNARGVLDYVGAALFNRNTATQLISMGASLLGSGGSFTSGAIMGAVSAMIGNPDLLKNAGNLLGQLLLNPAGVIGAVAGAAQGLFTQINDTIRERGIVGALSNLVTHIFGRETQEIILQSGGLDTLLSGSGINTTFEGQSAREYRMGGGSSLFFNSLNQLIGKKENGVTQSGQFGLNSRGMFGLITGNIVANLLGGGYTFTAEIKDGGVKNLDVKDDLGTAVIHAEGENGRTIDFDIPDTLNTNNEPQTTSFNWSNFILDLSQLGMLFRFGQDGQLQNATSQVNASTGQTVTDPDKLLYLLVNGVNNTDNVLGSGVNTPPEYYVALRGDLVQVDQNIDPNKDVAITSIYPSVHLDGDWIRNATIDDNVRSGLQTAFNRFKDVVALRLEADIRAIPGFEVLSIMKQLNVFAAGLRPVQGIGYSGGFAPMLEAMNMMNMDTQMIMGVGAATLDLTRFRDVLGMTVKTLSSLLDERVLTQNSDFLDKAKTACQEFYEFAKSIPLFGPIVNAFGTVIDAIFGAAKSVFEKVLDLANEVFKVFSNLIESAKVQALIDINPLVGLTNLQNQAEGVINIYGDKDLLNDLGIGGYRTSVAGFNGNRLINIEIKSQRGAIADHYIYMHNIRSAQDYADLTANGNPWQDEFDDKVAEFVAALLVAGKTPETAIEFFNQLPASMGEVRVGPNGAYVFYPFGENAV